MRGYLPMQKVVLRPNPVFMLVSACSAVFGDSQETQSCHVTRSSSQRASSEGLIDKSIQLPLICAFIGRRRFEA
jgi:hypothetical protein